MQSPEHRSEAQIKTRPDRVGFKAHKIRRSRARRNIPCYARRRITKPHAPPSCLLIRGHLSAGVTAEPTNVAFAPRFEGSDLAGPVLRYRSSESHKPQEDRLETGLDPTRPRQTSHAPTTPPTLQPAECMLRQLKRSALFIGPTPALALPYASSLVLELRRPMHTIAPR